MPWRSILVLCIMFMMTSISYAGERVVRIAAMEWEPYTSSGLNAPGFYGEIVKEAFARSGHEVELIFLPWKRALLQVKEGAVDGVIGAGYTEERTSYMSYPDYAWESEFYFYHTKAALKRVADYSELCPATLGQLRATRVTKLVQAAAPCIEIEFVDSIKKNLDKLLYGRIDYMINTPETMQHLVREHHPDMLGNLYRVELPLEEVKIYTTFSKQVDDWKALTESFDAGVESMKEDGTYDVILKRHGMR